MLYFIMSKKTEKKAKPMPVNLKFFRDPKENKMVSYVTKSGGSWKGVREAEKSCKKKIVVLGTQVKDVMDGVLYHAYLIPMIGKDGYVCIGVNTVQFEAGMEVLFHKSGGYYVKITFGNKQMVFDPKNKNKQSSDLNAFIARLSKRVDIKNINKLIDDFIEVVNVNSYPTE